MKASFKTEGIVLRKRIILHKDILLYIFTHQFGKITATAKGIRDITSKRISALMTGNLLRLELSLHEGRYYLRKTDIISIFSSIKKDEQKQKIVYFFLYLLDRLLPEGEPEPEIYSLLKRICIILSKRIMLDSEKIVYTNKLLKILGYEVHAQSLTEITQHIEQIIGKKIPNFII